MSSFIWPGTSTAVPPTYATSASFPSSAVDGQLVEALDTHILYVYDLALTSWLPIGGTSVPLGIGAIDGQTPVANGLQIVSNLIYAQSADATHPGMVNITTQSFAGNKTFTGTIVASNLSGTNTGNVTIGAFGSTPNANGLSLSGQVINLQPADATHSGGLSSTDWNTFNNKQSTLTLGNLTDTGTDGITIGSGTGAVVGSGTTISQHVADSTHNGYLSSTDWSTFNGKQASGNYITDLTGDGTASGPGSAALTLATVNTNVGSFGSSTAIPSFTVNNKGLITAAGSSAVIAPAGTLTGTTLASNVVTSSLTALGTIATGIWQGTAVGSQYGGTGANLSASTGAISVSSGTVTAGTLSISNGGTNNGSLAVTAGGVLYTDGSKIVNVGAGTATYVLTSNGASPPTWAAPGGGSATALLVHCSSNFSNGSGNSPIIFNTVDFDTASAYSTITGQYTAPTTGYYHINATTSAAVGVSFPQIYVMVNSTKFSLMGTTPGSGNSSGSTMVFATAGDTIQVNCDSSTTFAGGAAPYATSMSLHLIK